MYRLIYNHTFWRSCVSFGHGVTLCLVKIFHSYGNKVKRPNMLKTTIRCQIHYKQILQKMNWRWAGYIARMLDNFLTFWLKTWILKYRTQIRGLWKDDDDDDDDDKSFECPKLTDPTRVWQFLTRSGPRLYASVLWFLQVSNTVWTWTPKYNCPLAKMQVIRKNTQCSVLSWKYKLTVQK